MSTFDDTLNAQIETLHEIVKDTPEYQQKQMLNNLLKAFADLKPIFDDLMNNIADLWQEIIQVVKDVVKSIVAFYWNMQRDYLFCEIKRKHPFIPDNPLSWIIQHIPDRWLMRVREMI